MDRSASRITYSMNARANNASQDTAALGMNAAVSEAHFIIQDCSCGIYFAGLGTWTAAPMRALGFSSEQEAEGFARQQGLHNVRIVRRAITVRRVHVSGGIPLHHASTILGNTHSQRWWVMAYRERHDGGGAGQRAVGRASLPGGGVVPGVDQGRVFEACEGEKSGHGMANIHLDGTRTVVGVNPHFTVASLLLWGQKGPLHETSSTSRNPRPGMV